MDAKISSYTLMTACAAVVAIESAAVMALSKSGIPSIMITGIARIADIAALFMILSKSREGCGGIGYSAGQLWTGLQRGILWSCGFAGAATLIFGGVRLAGHNPLQYFHVAMPVDTMRILPVFIVGGLLAPVAEELFFRGVIFGFFRRWGFPAALVVSTVLFVCMHPHACSFPITRIVGGIVFAAAYEREKNLLVPITIHGLGNMALFSLSVIFRLF